MKKLLIHLLGQKGWKTIVKNLKKLDKDLMVRDYGTFVVVESNTILHYVSCNCIENNKMVLKCFDNTKGIEVLIPLNKIDTIFA